MKEILFAFFCASVFSGLSVVYAADRDSCEIDNLPKSIINARDEGAVGDGQVDDTLALQRAIDRASVVKGVVAIPSGIYIVDAVKGINLKSNVTLDISPGAVIKAAKNSKSTFSILKISSVNNVAVIGGTFQGERFVHEGISGEWGMGIWIANANNVLLKNLTSKENWGDGIYIGGGSKNVNICSVVVDGNRRQGMSIVDGENILVVNSTFSNTNGKSPEAGLDVEPNRGQSIKNVEILNSKFLNNNGAGITSYVPSNASVQGLKIAGNIIENNRQTGISITNLSEFRILNNNLIENSPHAIFLDSKTRAGVVRGNKIINRRVAKGLISENGVNAVSDNIISIMR